jgi:hypothetical protein
MNRETCGSHFDGSQPTSKSPCQDGNGYLIAPAGDIERGTGAEAVALPPFSGTKKPSQTSKECDVPLF